MSTPIPAPRTRVHEINKKPVPTPRKMIKIARSDSVSSKSSEETTSSYNTFSRRARSISHASKQIAEDIAEIMQDKKRAVIEGTRQSVRRITRRFSTSPKVAEPEADDNDIQGVIDIFSSIRFNSPMTTELDPSSLDDNKSEGSVSSTESLGLPPPSHPPPPLPDDSIYDAPSSYTPVSSSPSTSTSASASNEASPSISTDTGTGTGTTSSQSYPENSSDKNIVYERIYPIVPQQDSSSSSGTSCGTGAESTVGTINTLDNMDSESWKFYDTAQNVIARESIYSNVDSTPALVPVVAPAAVDEDDARSIMRTNSLYENFSEVQSEQGGAESVYENCVVPPPRTKRRAANSVILQFDPLKTNGETQEQDSESRLKDMRMLEQLLGGELYGNGAVERTIDSWSISDSEAEEFVSPPPPPTRFDSLPEDEQSQQNPTPSSKEKSRTSWFVAGNESPPRSPNTDGSRKSRFFSMVREVLDKAPEVLRGAPSKDAVVQRPHLGPKSFVQKKGMLYRVQGGAIEDFLGEYSGRWCVLENGSMVCYSDNTCETVKEYFPTETVLSIQVLQDPKYKYKHDNNDLHCFELNTTGKNRGGHVYGARDVAERRKWAQCIAECLTYKFSSKITSDYSRMGWAYVREGVSGKWTGAWLLLSHRSLHYSVDGQAIRSVDLRRARCIGLQPYQETDNNPRTNDRGPNMLLDWPGAALYLRMWTMRETKVWCHIVKLAAHNNGANLDQQQLTGNEIPVIVEKCINFIYAHGSMSQGIYRRSGTGSLVTDILTRFSKDAWEFQLTIDKYSEHDVANALKRFFRDLPEPLLSSNQRQYFYQVSLVNDKKERIRMYKAALDHLPPVSYKTAKKLIGHLHFISTQSDKNLMTVSNLASLWGPTLMHFDNKELNTTTGTGNHHHQQDVAVVGQLISLYKYIFPEDAREMEQEKLMLQVLKKYASSPQGPVNNKTAGDLRVWIYLHNKEGRTFNVALGPSKTAYEVCIEVSSKINIPVHELTLEEVVLNDKLVRPIHHTEKVLNVVLSWGYWDEPDRKDNHLVITRLSKYWEFIQEKHSPLSSELKFADLKSKHFKVLTFELAQAKLNVYKDKSCEVKLHSWNVEDIVWYLGNEPKRNAQTKWTVTFMEKSRPPKRTKATPHFGNVIAWQEPSARALWLGAILKCVYPHDLNPPAQHVNLISP